MGGRQSQKAHYLVDNQEKPTSVKDDFKYLGEREGRGEMVFSLLFQC